MTIDLSTVDSIVVLTGAGISAESGLKTFRASDGLWEGHPVDEVATPEGFAHNPALVHDFYNARRRQLPTVAPNKAHCALGTFEKQFSGDFLLVTQNVDNLHERGGSENLIHMHGELLKSRCIACNTVRSIDVDMTQESTCGDCGEQGTLRPDIVWFGEMPMEMDRIYSALANCDLFVSIGTSGNVYPAAGFVQEAKMTGAKTVELNLEPGEHANGFDLRLYGPATERVPEFFYF